MPSAGQGRGRKGSLFVHECLCDYLRPARGIKILDLEGCGYGGWCEWVGERVMAVVEGGLEARGERLTTPNAGLARGMSGQEEMGRRWWGD